MSGEVGRAFGSSLQHFSTSPTSEERIQPALNSDDDDDDDDDDAGGGGGAARRMPEPGSIFILSVGGGQ